MKLYTVVAYYYKPHIYYSFKLSCSRTLMKLYTVFAYYYKPVDLYDAWDELKYKGILHGRLIHHLWKEFSAEVQTQLLDVMEQFDLICTAPGYRRTEQTLLGTSTPVHRNYFVPSLFNPHKVKDMDDLTSTTSLTFFVDFHGLFTSTK